MNAVKKLKKNDHFCDLAPPRNKIKIPGPNVDSYVNKWSPAKNRKNWVMDEG